MVWLLYGGLGDWSSEHEACLDGHILGCWKWILRETDRREADDKEHELGPGSVLTLPFQYCVFVDSFFPSLPQFPHL